MKNRRKGFTLIELLVVIIVLGILAALIVPRVVNRTSQARVTKAQSDIAQLSSALQTFKLDTDRFPTTEEGLDALQNAPADIQNWRGPYLTKPIPADPWNTPYQYTLNSEDQYEILSYGADGQEGGDGDNADLSEGAQQ